jgi:hypothetical protein
MSDWWGCRPDWWGEAPAQLSRLSRECDVELILVCWFNPRADLSDVAVSVFSLASTKRSAESEP